LSRWLTRAAGASGDLASIERAGRDIGRDLAPEGSARGAAAAMHDALAAFGFAPSHEQVAPRGLRFTLTNCPYREAVRQNQAVVCRLHRGITTGLLEGIDPGARLVSFVAKDPYAAGCLIELEGLASAG
jgi:predicted ArsR family transcriptional regulator